MPCSADRHLVSPVPLRYFCRSTIVDSPGHTHLANLFSMLKQPSNVHLEVAHEYSSVVSLSHAVLTFWLRVMLNMEWPKKSLENIQNMEKLSLTASTA
jgi:hypothetical protein